MHTRMHAMHHPGHGHGPGRHRARRGALRASVLHLLNERTMHGYDLINEFAERSGGRWKPSPGSIYPTLAHLEDEGLIRGVDEDGRRRFELTDDGRAWVVEHPEHESPWERAGVGGGRGDLRRLGGEIFGQLRQLARFGTTSQLDRAAALLARTRTELYGVLADAGEEPTDESTPLPSDS